MHTLKSSLEKFDISDEDKRLVILSIPYEYYNVHSVKNAEVYLSLLEQNLACNYQNYQTIIEHGKDDDTHLFVKILFDNIEDAALFKLQRDF